MSKPVPGSVTWRDVTVENAESLRDFYESVAGWTSSPVDQGGYNDFVMLDTEGNGVSGICHAKGSNSGLPPQWLIYITVEDLDARLEQVVALGGRVVNGPRSVGADRMAVIEDPAGAVCALYQPAADQEPSNHSA
jgi:uncharacterized protein